MKPKTLFTVALVSACMLLTILLWSRVSVSAAAKNESMESASGSDETANRPVWETLPGQIFSAF